MKRVTILMLLALTVSATALAQEQPMAQKQSQGPEIYFGVLAGYYNGGGFQLNAMFAKFAENFPMNARFGFGYSSVEPGSAAEARQIFINNATNGIPEEQGRLWSFNLDLMYPFKFAGLQRNFLSAGPRYARYTGNFKYIGGNEDFDVTSNSWGLGAGLESHFAMGTKIDLVLTAGYDDYPTTTLSGHDTQYSPDGDNVNPREDFTYSDADAAIDQPKGVPRLMFGINYRY
jgi:hypothetical protein